MKITTDSDLDKRLRVLSAAAGVSASAYVSALLRQYLPVEVDLEGDDDLGSAASDTDRSEGE